ncbi:hypothetical protein, partial [Nonomuraea ceibae]|uniref:hypothetical protein n=1 Tax=Nonomuraea ceibae TaxID=1935170 RepID=UPI001C5E9136
MLGGSRNTAETGRLLGNNYLPLLDQHYGSHRSALFTLVASIELESTAVVACALVAACSCCIERFLSSPGVPEVDAS